MEEVDTVLEPGQGGPDRPAQQTVDDAPPVLDTGQDDPGDGEGPGYLGKPIEEDPVNQWRCVPTEGYGHPGVKEKIVIFNTVDHGTGYHRGQGPAPAGSQGVQSEGRRVSPL